MTSKAARAAPVVVDVEARFSGVGCCGGGGPPGRRALLGFATERGVVG